MEFLVGLAIAGALIVAAMFLLLAVLLKAVWWAVTLPVRLAFYLLLLPIWLAGRALRVVALGIMAPVLAVAGMLLAGLVILAGLVAAAPYRGNHAAGLDPPPQLLAAPSARPLIIRLRASASTTRSAARTRLPSEAAPAPRTSALSAAVLRAGCPA